MALVRGVGRPARLEDHFRQMSRRGICERESAIVIIWCHDLSQVEAYRNDPQAIVQCMPSTRVFDDPCRDLFGSAAGCAPSSETRAPGVSAARLPPPHSGPAPRSGRHRPRALGTANSAFSAKILTSSCPASMRRSNAKKIANTERTAGRGPAAQIHLPGNRSEQGGTRVLLRSGMAGHWGVSLGMGR